ncbi:hypothetical protein MRB53_040476 [Persea americana]|nr:hypothetical protein MRB53_040476 [Persea americana]
MRRRLRRKTHFVKYDHLVALFTQSLKHKKHLGEQTLEIASAFQSHTLLHSDPASFLISDPSKPACLARARLLHVRVINPLSDFPPRIRDYLTTSNVQLGATYATGRLSSASYAKAYAAAASFINASPENITLAASTTQLFRNFSLALLPGLLHSTSASPSGSDGSKQKPSFVISVADHEANIAAWVALAELVGVEVRFWRPEILPADSKSSSGLGATDKINGSDGINGTNKTGSKNPHLTPSTLAPLLSQSTLLVSCTHASNITGTITALPALGHVIRQHAPQALFIVDGVALAPHRPVDVKVLEEAGVDVYAFSWYKVFGPHIAQLWASRRARERIGSLAHWFKRTGVDAPSAPTVPVAKDGDAHAGLNGAEKTAIGDANGHARDAHKDNKTALPPLEEKLGLAGASYELLAALPRITSYIQTTATWPAIVAQEGVLAARLLSHLTSPSRRSVYTVVGDGSADVDTRVPVVSFLVKGRGSKSVVEEVEKKCTVGFRWGHFYSLRLLESLGVEEGMGGKGDGVVRVSLCHYNTVEEVDGFLEVLDGVCCQGREVRSSVRKKRMPKRVSITVSTRIQLLPARALESPNPHRVVSFAFPSSSLRGFRITARRAYFS